ncbi:MAG: DUF1573 domain-containing protein [Marinifilaceae bacterium]|jgi:hypothetical protein|nr:DUF1573 domain-containing protein [Marinifilaceae bacterium]
MNRIISIFICILLISCSSKKNKEKSQSKLYSEFEFSEDLNNFGEIKHGEIAIYDFWFKNTGNKDLIINNIETGCGCTTANWEKRPVKPGEKSKISVEFDSAGRSGKQYKALYVYSNSYKSPYQLTIVAEVN